MGDMHGSGAKREQRIPVKEKGRGSAIEERDRD